MGGTSCYLNMYVSGLQFRLHCPMIIFDKIGRDFSFNELIPATSPCNKVNQPVESSPE